MTGAAVGASQPLPRGKANFSLCFGNFDAAGGTWVRMGNWTFNASAGTVTATYWHWDSTLERGKAALNSHTCLQGGVSQTCNSYTPTGWIAPGGYSFNWSGNYTYDAGTAILTITWGGGNGTEQWLVTSPATNIARLTFVSSSYGITHGRGYGSNATWSTYKLITEVPRILYPGYTVDATLDSSGALTITPSTPGAWSTSSLNLTSFTPSTNGNCLHAWLAASSGVCTGPCATARTGIVYHVTSDNAGRSMAYTHWCACLTSDAAWPCYSGQLHPYAMQQIIDDSGAMLGMVGIQEQDEPGSAGYTYSLRDYTQAGSSIEDVVTDTWSGAGTDNNWSTSANWDLGTPGITTTVYFNTKDPAIDRGTPNNTVDANSTISSLFYWTTNVWQTTQIPTGNSLSVTGMVIWPVYSGFTPNVTLFCGKWFQDAPVNANAAILGAGALIVSNPAAMMSSRCYGGTATLDLSGLNTFRAAVSQLTVGCEGYTEAAGQNRSGGTLYLASTNFIRGYSTASTAAGSGLPLAIGENRANAGAKSWVYLGRTNVFLADFGIVVGGARSLGQLQFNPTNPTPGAAYFRNLAGTGRQSEWRIGDNNTSSTGTGANGTVDFTGGTVDAQVDLLYVGRGQPGANTGSGVGTLLLSNGIVDANYLRVGYMNGTTGDPGPCSGTVTTSGGPTVTNLVVNNDVVLGRDIGATYNAQGALNIGSAVIVKGNVVAGGGTGSSVTLNGGWLWVGGKLGNNGGVNDTAIGTLNLTSGTLTLNLGSAGNPIAPVCNANSLNLGAITLNLEGSGLSAGVIPLIREYTSLSGSFAGITRGTLPAQIHGYFSNSVDTLYLVVTSVGTPRWNGATNGVANGNWDINTTANWIGGVSGLPTTYAQPSVPGDAVLFDDSAAGTTTVNLTTALSPTTVTINNSAKTYTFTGSGGLSGPGGLLKQGSSPLVLGNGGTNNFAGAVSVAGGKLQLSGSSNRLPTSAVVALADAPGAVLDLHSLDQQLTALSGGGLSGGNVTLGTATLTLVGNGSAFAGVISGEGKLLKSGSGSQILSGANTFSGGTVISNGTLTVANDTGSGSGTGGVMIAGGTLQLGNGGAAGSIAQGVVTNNGTLAFNHTDDLTFTNLVTGTGGLLKLAANNITISRANTFSGSTTISDGALRITNPGALGSAGSTLSIGSSPLARLELGNNIILTQPLILASKGGALGSPPHVQNLSGTNTLTGLIQGTWGGTDWSFQSDEGLLIVAGAFTNATPSPSQVLNLRGAGFGAWQSAVANGSSPSYVVALTKWDAGTWTLVASSTNTYTGLTTIKSGYLVVNGAILNSSGVSINSGATLAGSGLIACPVTNAPFAFISPGNGSIGTLTISNRLLCDASSTCVFDVSALGGDRIRGLTTVTYGGSLRIVLNGTLSANAVFKLFDAAHYEGAFGSFDLPTIPSPLTWDSSHLTADGTLRVIGGPEVTSFGFGGTTNFQISGTGALDESYRILATTNLNLPLSLWVQVSSGMFAGGVFTFTDTNAANGSRRFYRVGLP